MGPQIKRTTIQFKRNIPVENIFFNSKPMTVLFWQSDWGGEHYSEIPELPHFLPESGDEVYNQLKVVPWGQWKKEKPSSFEIKALEKKLTSKQALFTLEVLLLWPVIKKTQSVPIHLLYSPNKETSFSHEIKQAKALAQKWNVLGITTIKAKIGLRPYEEEIELLSIFSETIKGLHWRLDGNQRLNLNQLKQWIDGPPIGVCDYFESPCFENFADQMSFPLAIDKEISLKDLPHLPKQLTTVILRPEKIGLEASQELMATLKSLKIKTVLSSTYEGPIGLQSLAYLATKTPGAHGLGTWEIIKNQDEISDISQFLKNFPQIQKGELRFF